MSPPWAPPLWRPDAAAPSASASKRTPRRCWPRESSSSRRQRPTNGTRKETMRECNSGLASGEAGRGDDGVMSAGVLRYIQEPVVEMIDTNIAPLASAASVTRPLVRDLIGANNQTDSHRSSSWFKFTAALINLTLQQFSSAVSILFRWIWFCLLYIAD